MPPKEKEDGAEGEDVVDDAGGAPKLKLKAGAAGGGTGGRGD